MSKSIRYQLETNFKLKKAHKQMLNNFEVKQVSTAKLKGGRDIIYFSLKNSDDQSKIESFLSERKLSFKQMNI